TLHTYSGVPLDVIKMICQEYDVQGLYCNGDYEPQAIKRDDAVQRDLKEIGIPCYASKDQVIFEKSEVVKADGSPYTVYTPYAKKWTSILQPAHYGQETIALENFYKAAFLDIISLETLGFQKTDLVFEQPQLAIDIIKDYGEKRDFPALDHTPRLGIA